MTYLLAIAITLHTLSAVIWVGGMFFAHFALRPAANHLLEPPLRLFLAFMGVWLKRRYLFILCWHWLLL